MSEYDKMLAGKLYDPSDGELTAMRMRARRLCAAYNSSDCGDEKGRTEILSQLLGAVGGEAMMEPSISFEDRKSVV